MEKYNYYAHMYDNVLWAIKNDYDLAEYDTRDKAEEALYDVAIRCYLLAGALTAVLNDMTENGETPKKWKEG